MSGFALLARPARRPGSREFSPFEFWPGWLFYAPVVAHWLWLAIRHRSLTLPTAANPSIETGGLCGESKSAILDSISPAGRSLVAPSRTFTTGPQNIAQANAASQGLGWPLVLKPDIGCNGAGVRLIRSAPELHEAVAAFPIGVRLMLQAFSPHPGEAGIFYVRRPDAPAGSIVSITLKFSPTVVGDGRTTLRDLALAHPRAGRKPHLYLPRLRPRLDTVLPAGAIIPLVFTGNHCKGSVFEDGQAAITPALTRQIDAFAQTLPNFHFGRIDVRYASEAALRAGQAFTVIEVNGVGSEATHIWDARCTLRQAYATQFQHYGLAWQIAAVLRARGAEPSSLHDLWTAWRRQRRLMASYPISD